jgi:hypothetical protein
MQGVQQSRLDALRRVKAFLDENATALGNVNKSTSRAALDAVLASLEARAAVQDGATSQAASATQHKEDVREDLRLHHMQPIAAIARATLAHTPFISKLRLPRQNLKDSGLISAGTAMADVAAQYSDVFIAEQLPADFLAQLRTAVDTLKEAVVSRDSFQRSVTQATQGVDDEMLRASNVVKVLNSLVVKQLKGHGDLLAGWRRAKHPKAKPGVPRGTVRGGTTPGTTPTPSITATATAAAAPTAAASAAVPAGEAKAA